LVVGSSPTGGKTLKSALSVVGRFFDIWVEMMKQQALPNFVTQLDSTTRSTYHIEILETLNIHTTSNWSDKFGRNLRMWLKNNGNKPIKTLSLFTGGSGLDMGFHDAGFHSVVEKVSFSSTIKSDDCLGSLFFFCS